jgi:phosphotriesterase-related protein
MNISGKVMTVKGAIDPSDLKKTITHEHFFIDLRKSHLPHQPSVYTKNILNLADEDVLFPKITSFPSESTEVDFPATELNLWNAKVDFGNLHLAKDRASIADNYILSDVNLAIKEALEFKNNGGSTVVDVTNRGLKRDPEALLKLSEATGLNIIMGSSWYQKMFHPRDMDDKSVENLTDEIVEDITVGVNGTDIKSGIIGEVGVNGGPITRNEEKCIISAAIGSKLTGAPITIHSGGVGEEKHHTLDLIEKEGVSLNRVIMGHSDWLADHYEFALELIDRNVFLEFDLIGRESALEISPTAKDIQIVTKLVQDGHEDKILLSQDVCHKTNLKHYGGFGYSFVLEKFIPHLHSLGISNSSTDKMLIDNPKKVLQFIAPNY